MPVKKNKYTANSQKISHKNRHKENRQYKRKIDTGVKK
jgi:hypothetical protein